MEAGCFSETSAHIYCLRDDSSCQLPAAEFVKRLSVLSKALVKISCRLSGWVCCVMTYQDIVVQVFLGVGHVIRYT